MCLLTKKVILAVGSYSSLLKVKDFWLDGRPCSRRINLARTASQALKQFWCCPNQAVEACHGCNEDTVITEERLGRLQRPAGRLTCWPPGPYDLATSSVAWRASRFVFRRHGTPCLTRFASRPGWRKMKADFTNQHRILFRWLSWPGPKPV